MPIGQLWWRDGEIRPSRFPELPSKNRRKGNSLEVGSKDEVGNKNQEGANLRTPCQPRGVGGEVAQIRRAPPKRNGVARARNLKANPS